MWFPGVEQRPEVRGLIHHAGDDVVVSHRRHLAPGVPVSTEYLEKLSPSIHIRNIHIPFFEAIS